MDLPCGGAEAHEIRLAPGANRSRTSLRTRRSEGVPGGHRRGRTPLERLCGDNAVLRTFLERRGDAFGTDRCSVRGIQLYARLAAERSRTPLERLDLKLEAFLQEVLDRCSSSIVLSCVPDYVGGGVHPYAADRHTGARRHGPDASGARASGCRRRAASASPPSLAGHWPAELYPPGAMPFGQPERVAETAGAAPVHIDSSPAGAHVGIDGASSGQTPLDVRLSPGRHQLSLQHPDVLDGEQTLQVEDSGAMVDIDLWRRRAGCDAASTGVSGRLAPERAVPQ